MKAWAVLLSVAALASAAPLGLETQTIQDDLQDFVNLLPQEQIADIVLRYVSCDKEVGAIAEYLQSDDFKEFLTAVNALPEIIELHNYLENSGLGASSVENNLRSVSHRSARSTQLADGDALPNCDLPITGGLRGLVRDILTILPLDQIKMLFVQKMKTSPEFRVLVARLTSPELRSIIMRLRANPDFQLLVLEAKADVGAIINQVQALIEVYHY